MKKCKNCGKEEDEHFVYKEKLFCENYVDKDDKLNKEFEEMEIDIDEVCLRCGCKRGDHDADDYCYQTRDSKKFKGQKCKEESAQKIKMENNIDTIEITKEMLERCAIPKPKLSMTQTFENGDEYYEDENYIGWNGMCVEKPEEDKWEDKKLPKKVVRR